MRDVKENHGYLAVPRHSKMLFQELGYELYGFYLGLVMNAVWQRGNKNFGKVVMTQTELATSLNMTQSCVSRNFKRLEKHKFFAVRMKRYILLRYFPLFLTDVAKKIHSKDYANLHELYADVYRINAEVQADYANSQDKRTSNNLLRLNSSSNDYLYFSPVNTSKEVDMDEIDI